MRQLLAILALLCSPAFAGRTFNSTSDLINIPGSGTAVDINNGPMTISLWMYPTDITSKEHDPISHWGGGTFQYLIAIGSGAIGGPSEAGFYVGTVGAETGIYGGCGSLSPNHWYNIVMAIDTAGTFSGTPALTFYVSGFVTCSVEIAFVNHRTSASTPVTIGGQAGSANFQGTIAEVGIWNQILSPAEITALQNGISPNQIREPGFAAYYPLYGIASPEPDFGGNILNGVLTGTTAGPQCPCGKPVRF
jgi:hypothetical protein